MTFNQQCEYVLNVGQSDDNDSDVNKHKKCLSTNRRITTEKKIIKQQTIMSILLPLIIYIIIPGCWASTDRQSRHIIPPSTPAQPTSPPVFDPKVKTNITVTASKTALLSCIVHNLGNNTVSWIRHRDLHILSVGPVTYSSDDRFKVVPDASSGNWALRIKFANPRDSGTYDCQVSARPPTEQTVHLNVIEPKAKILKGPEMHLGVGSLINLTCVVPYSPEPPEYLYWYHKEQMVRSDGSRIEIQTSLGIRTYSQLVVKNAQVSDSGLYTCTPAHSKESSIAVHVLAGGEYPAAMQGGSSIICAGHWRLLWLMVAPLIIYGSFSQSTYFYM